jgi:hypothetical protein
MEDICCSVEPRCYINFCRYPGLTSWASYLSSLRDWRGLDPDSASAHVRVLAALTLRNKRKRFCAQLNQTSYPVEWNQHFRRASERDREALGLKP